MKVKSIKLKDFKRFTDLTIEGLPETAKLVVMIGPNGCGKSSVFDALICDIRFNKGSADPVSMVEDAFVQEVYRFKDNYPSANFPRRDFPIWKSIDVEFHHKLRANIDELGKRVHIRSAYRNYSSIHMYKIFSWGEDDFILSEVYSRLIEELRAYGSAIGGDEMFASNYRLLLRSESWKSSLPYPPYICFSQGYRDRIEGLFEFRDEILEELNKAIKEVFTDSGLVVKKVEDPIRDGLLKFEKEKGPKVKLSIENLSGGEIGALDLLLDVIVTKVMNDETIICIDEPEAHIHTKLQGQLLKALYDLIPDKSQLWIATHSVGMVRKAQDLWRDDPNSVVFLDFDGHDFDELVTLTPAEPNPNFWASTYEVALGDLAELVVTGRTVFCEGEEFDAECYKNIFKDRYPEIDFVSLGARGNVEKSVTAANLAIEKIVKRAKVIGIIDRDQATEGEIKRNAKKGIRTLSRTSIESYLLDDEVLAKLCEDHGGSDRVKDLLAAKQDALNKFGLKSSDNLKRIVQQVHGAAQGVLKSAYLGNDKESFMMDILAPCIQFGMKVYKELHKDIFGE